MSVLRVQPGVPRALAWMGLYLAILLAWLGLFWMTQVGDLAALRGAPAELWASLCQGAEAAELGPLVAMWALMAVAMMTPTFVPAFRTFLDLPVRATGGVRAAAVLFGGYLAVWALASVLGALAQQQLARAAWVAPTGQSLSPWLTAILLIGAGAYQFTRLKEACLSKCRRPLTFFMERWRPGLPGAFRMGAELGVLCLGCCWALMLLAFVGGTMNLAWMGLATLFMTFEKLPDIGRWLTRPSGLALVVAGLGMSARAAGWI